MSRGISRTITSVAAGDLIFVLNLFTICFDPEEGGSIRWGRRVARPNELVLPALTETPATEATR
jgi:hypothetical protein